MSWFVWGPEYNGGQTFIKEQGICQDWEAAIKKDPMGEHCTKVYCEQIG